MASVRSWRASIGILRYIVYRCVFADIYEICIEVIEGNTNFVRSRRVRSGTVVGLGHI